MDVALREIGKAGRFSFSYDADLIPVDRQVSVNANNVEVSELLKELVGKDIRSREIGNHLVLIRNRSDSREKLSFPDIEVRGTILNASNRMPLKDASVFELEDKSSAISADDGTYKLLIPTGKKRRTLTYCKSGYTDTIIFINQLNEYQINVLLHPLQEDLSRLNPRSGFIEIRSIDSLGMVNWLTPRETGINAQNLELGSSRMFQVSLIPYLSTNWKVTASITNRFSLNVLAGYTGGLKGLELGGLLNITRNNMSGVQISGMGNIVGARGAGLQIGGLFNYDLGKFEGVQLAGLFNHVPDTVTGAQISIITNIAGNYCNCWQVSAILNVAKRDVRKVQLSGLGNYGRNVDGIQFAGLLNIARDHNDGIQIAGGLNYATTVNGLQLGMINISNSVDRGIPIGLFCYVQHGYHLFEVSGNEIFYANVAFKSGTKNFYNFLQLGVGKDYKLIGAYGIGTIFTLKNKLSMNLDASAGFVYHPTDTIYHGLLLKFNPALEYRFKKHFAIFLGPAYNFFLFTKGQPSATSRGLSSYDFYFKSTPNTSIQMWIGGVLGVRF